MVKTPIQQLADVKQVIGQPVYLRLGEELLNVVISDTCVMLAIRTVETKPYTVGYKVTKQGIKLLTWELDADAAWPTWKHSKMVTWDDDFVPYEVGTLGGKPVSEWHERRAWEDDCFRPGNGTRLGQRDSADRQFQGYDYTPGSTFYSTETGKS